MTNQNSTDNSKPLSQNIELTHPSKTEAEITGEIPAEEMKQYHKQALQGLAEELEIDGFRKGQVPAELAEKHLGEQQILYQAAELALQQEYPKLLEHLQLAPVGAPRINVTKIASGSPLGFKINTALMPEVKLPDYKQIAAEQNASEDPKTAEVNITEAEVDKVINHLEQQMSQQQEQQSGQGSSDLVGPNGESLSSNDQFKITDETVGQFGDFQSVVQLREKVQENLKREKQAQNIEQHRLKIMEQIIEQSNIDLPDMIVEEELNRMIAQLKQDIEQAGLTFEQYLEQMQKTEADLRQEWQSQAEKRAKLQLALNRIAEQEQIEPDQTVLEEQSRIIQEQHPKADPKQIRTYVSSQLKNEAVFKMLEEQPAKTAQKSPDDSKKTASNSKKTADKKSSGRKKE